MKNLPVHRRLLKIGMITSFIATAVFLYLYVLTTLNPEELKIQPYAVNFEVKIGIILMLGGVIAFLIVSRKSPSKLVIFAPRSELAAVVIFFLGAFVAVHGGSFQMFEAIRFFMYEIGKPADNINSTALSFLTMAIGSFIATAYAVYKLYISPSEK